MSLTGSCFSSESAPRPFHHGIRERGGRNSLFRDLADRPYGGFKRTCELTSSIVPRGTSFHHSMDLEFPPIAFDATRYSCHCALPGPSELGAVNPDAVEDHSQPTCQSDDRPFHPAAPGDLHRPGLEPRPFLRTQHALRRFVEHNANGHPLAYVYLRTSPAGAQRRI
jgi:hypothetical protein